MLTVLYDSVTIWIVGARAGADAVWTIAQLGEMVDTALSRGYDGQANGRVREVPDRRTIRYYTTLGLIDRPVIRGRTAFYGKKHLVQLVAIKRLQAEGRTLAEVQVALAGAQVSTLERIARIPLEAELPMPASGARPSRTEGPGRAGSDAKRSGALAGGFIPPIPSRTVTARAPEAGRRRRAFWSEVPAQRAPGDETPPIVTGYSSGDVTVLFPSPRALDREDTDALREALGPLVRVLLARGLLKPSADRER
jgi:DNA-binding transcriptional MerR regulator